MVFEAQAVVAPDEGGAAGAAAGGDARAAFARFAGLAGFGGEPVEGGWGGGEGAGGGVGGDEGAEGGVEACGKLARRGVGVEIVQLTAGAGGEGGQEGGRQWRHLLGCHVDGGGAVTSSQCAERCLENQRLWLNQILMDPSD